MLEKGSWFMLSKWNIKLYLQSEAFLVDFVSLWHRTFLHLSVLKTEKWWSMGQELYLLVNVAFLGNCLVFYCYFLQQIMSFLTLLFILANNYFGIIYLWGLGWPDHIVHRRPLRLFWFVVCCTLFFLNVFILVKNYTFLYLFLKTHTPSALQPLSEQKRKKKKEKEGKQRKSSAKFYKAESTVDSYFAASCFAFLKPKLL